MKTALEELIEWINMGIGNCIEVGNQDSIGPLKAARFKAAILLEKEKQQIIDAFAEGFDAQYESERPEALTGKEYYKETFNPELLTK